MFITLFINNSSNVLNNFFKFCFSIIFLSFTYMSTVISVDDRYMNFASVSINLIILNILNINKNLYI